VCKQNLAAINVWPMGKEKLEGERMRPINTYLLVAWQVEEEHAIGAGPMSEVLSFAAARRREQEEEEEEIQG
jgi:hypothetical protein